mmetsp:Transcript_24999/g.25385  ORF Transcript_24999/g.25385 Transcript_24999/m.25385 type:complete len:85 (+) Transcript_24999:929-1183(+)
MIIVELCKVKRTINIKLGEKGRTVSQSHIHSASHHIISRQAGVVRSFSNRIEISLFNGEVGNRRMKVKEGKERNNDPLGTAKTK